MVKLTFKQIFKNHIDNNGERGYKTKLAQIAGYSKPGGFTKVLDDEKKEFDNFQGLNSVVKYVWKDQEFEMMVLYSNEVNPNRKTARDFLEYFALNRQFEAMNNLIEKMEYCENDISKEWAKSYKLLYNYELASESEICNVLKEINHLNVNTFEMKVFRKMMLNYCFSQMTEYSMVKSISKEIESEVLEIEDEYIKEMYTVRSNQIMSYTYLRVLNNPEEARKCCDNIISSSPTKSFEAYAYFYKGMSYLFTSHENTISNLKKAIELYEQQNRTKDVEYLKEKLEFANVYWDKFDNEKANNNQNQILLNIKKGKDVTNDLVENKDNMISEFYLYLEGLHTKNEKKLLLSLIKYRNKNDLFYANLAKIELLKNGYDEEILAELI